MERSLLNSIRNAKETLLEKVVLQNRTSLPHKGEPVPFIKWDVFQSVFIPDESAAMSHLIHHTAHKQMPFVIYPQPGEINKSMIWIMRRLMEKLPLLLGITAYCIFYGMCLNCRCGACLQCSQRATTGAIPML